MVAWHSHNSLGKSSVLGFFVRQVIAKLSSSADRLWFYSSLWMRGLLPLALQSSRSVSGPLLASVQFTAVSVSTGIVADTCSTDICQMDEHAPC